MIHHNCGYVFSNHILWRRKNCLKFKNCIGCKRHLSSYIQEQAQEMVSLPVFSKGVMNKFSNLAQGCAWWACSCSPCTKRQDKTNSCSILAGYQTIASYCMAPPNGSWWMASKLQVCMQAANEQWFPGHPYHQLWVVKISDLTQYQITDIILL